MVDDFLTRPHGVRLRTAIWPAAHTATAGRGHARGTVLLLHGRTEFLEKYAETVAALQQRGFAVCSFDWRGQGLSSRLLPDPRKGHVGSYQDYLDDLHAVITERMQGNPVTPRPWLVLAHSMGGHIALRYAHDHPGLWAGAVLSVPMIDIALPAPIRAIADSAVHFWSNWAGDDHYTPLASAQTAYETPFYGNMLTSDPVRYQYNQELVRRYPHCVIGGTTWGWVRQSLDSVAILRQPRTLTHIDIPVLLLRAGADQVVDQTAIAEAADWLPDAQLVDFPDARHDLLQEQDHHLARLWQNFDTFSQPLTRPQTPT